MRLNNYIASVCIILGGASLFGAVIVKFFHIKVFGLVPFSFFSFADACLLLAIALYIREYVLRERDD